MALPTKVALPIKLLTHAKTSRVILYFENSPQRYYGRVSVMHEGQVRGSVDLPKINPDGFGVRNPDTTFVPVVISINAIVRQGEEIELLFDLSPSFAGTQIEKRARYSGQEEMEVCVRGRRLRQS